MKTVNLYNDYLLNMILESVKNDETILVLSSNLQGILTLINDEISKNLLEISKKYYSEPIYKVTLLDIVNDGKLDSISFYQSNKAIQKTATILGININRGEEISESDMNRISYNISQYGFSNMDEIKPSITSLGKIIKKIFGDEYKDHEIGIFVEKFKSLQSDTKDFEIVKGDEIVYWYNEENYTNGGGTLNTSCMSGEYCGDFIQFYAINSDKVNMLILKNPNDDSKIIGRALLWNINMLDGENVERIYMDRIYYIKDFIKEMFINYAKENGWLYKEFQNMEDTTKIVDSVDDKKYKYVLVKNMEDHDFYPYLDTLKFYDGKDITNNPRYIEKGKGKKLTDVDGGYNDMGVYVSYYDEYIEIDEDYEFCEWIEDYRYFEDCYWSDYYDVRIANDYAENEMVDCSGYCDDEYDKYRLPKDAYYSNYYKSYIANEFKENMMKCDVIDDLSDPYRLSKDCVIIDGKTVAKEFLDKYYKFDTNKKTWSKDAVWSDYYNTNINREDAISVIVDLQKNIKDWRYSDDDTWEYDEKTHKYFSK